MRRWAPVLVVATAVAVLASGCTLWSWGTNSFGQLGDGTTTDRDTPGVFAELPEWRQVDAGEDFGCAIGTDDSLWCWGANGFGRLGVGGVGVGSSGGAYAPLEAGPTESWESLATGSLHACAITTGDDLWCWGRGGTVGDGTTMNRSSPVPVGVGASWTSVAADDAHTCAIDTGAKLWCWGDNTNGEIGNGTSGTSVLAPTLVSGNASWSDVAPGGDHTCAIRTDQTLWCWGDNGHGQLANGSTGRGTATPVQVGTSSGWDEVGSGHDHACARRGDDLYCWGSSTDGQVGSGVTGVDVPTPTQIEPSTAWDQVVLGRANSCAITDTGEMKCWGANGRGQLGVGNPSSAKDTPQLVDGISTWVGAGVGDEHVCALTAAASIACWGHGESGQLGLGYRPVTELGPVPIDPAWTSIAGGSLHSCRVGSNRTLWCWGRDDRGQLGNGPFDGDSPVPVSVAPVSGRSWTAVAAGGATTCGLQTQQLRCWGAGTFGQIGDGGNADRELPTSLGNGWIAVDTGGSHTCAIRSSGTLWCWGRNSVGQLGDGTTTDRSVPTQVGALADWATVATGVTHTCAARTNGELSCWGDNANGQLGDGTTTDRSAPVVVSGTTFDRVAGGNGHTCAIATAGTLWCWGLGVFGQLGNGSTIPSTTPIQVGTATTWSDLDTGDFHTCGITAVGFSNTLSCWGANANGQVGDGTTTNRSSPVTVLTGLVFDVATGGNHTFSVGF